MCVTLAVAVSGCLGGSGAVDDPIGEIAENNDRDRSEVVEQANRVLEIHDIPVNEENRERVARMAWERRNAKENYDSWLALVCMWDEPLPGTESEDSWEQVEALADACAS